MKAVKLHAASSNHPDKWMAAAITEHRKVKVAFDGLKAILLKAGYLFLRAKNALAPDVEVGAYFARFEDQVSMSTIYRYMTFCEEMLAWAAAEYPRLAGRTEDLLTVGMKMALQSPKSFTALCRDLKLMRKFGEYDEVKYARKKLSAAQQLQFSFAEVQESIHVLGNFDIDSFMETLPGDVHPLAMAREIHEALIITQSKCERWLRDHAEHPVPSDTGTMPLALNPPKK